MRHQPGRVDASLPPYAIALAERARSGSLVIYAGAGLSYPPPTELPNGPKLAALVHAQLRGAFAELDSVPPDDLVLISDTVVALDGGEEALRQAIVGVAEFTSAQPSYGHRVLGLLLLEGVVDVLTTNWDDCIERSPESSRERVQAVVNQHDLANITGRSVLKIHGCATQPSTLLLTSDHLDHPPTWVIDQTRARLGAAVVVFVGIGDVAGYVKVRLAEALADVGLVENVRVVSPSIVAKWDTSQWSTVIPDLAVEHRIAQSADAFLELLASGYIYLSFAEMNQAASPSSPPTSSSMASATGALSRHDAVTILSWLRQSAVVAKSGTPMLREVETGRIILALGALADDDITILQNGMLQTSIGLIETLIAVGYQSAKRLHREARNRLEEHLSLGSPTPKFLVAGGMGWSEELLQLPADIFGDGSTDDVLDGPSNARPGILRAETVIL